MKRARRIADGVVYSMYPGLEDQPGFEFFDDGVPEPKPEDAPAAFTQGVNEDPPVDDAEPSRLRGRRRVG